MDNGIEKKNLEDYRRAFYSILYNAGNDLNVDDQLKLLLNMQFILDEKMIGYRTLLLRHIEIGITMGKIDQNNLVLP